MPLQASSYFCFNSGGTSYNINASQCLCRQVATFVTVLMSARGLIQSRNAFAGKQLLFLRYFWSEFDTYKSQCLCRQVATFVISYGNNCCRNCKSQCLCRQVATFVMSKKLKHILNFVAMPLQASSYFCLIMVPLNLFILSRNAFAGKQLLLFGNELTISQGNTSQCLCRQVATFVRLGALQLRKTGSQCLCRQVATFVEVFIFKSSKWKVAMPLQASSYFCLSSWLRKLYTNCRNAFAGKQLLLFYAQLWHCLVSKVAMPLQASSYFCL